jgi:hypothetical protein
MSRKYFLGTLFLLPMVLSTSCRPVHVSPTNVPTQGNLLHPLPVARPNMTPSSASRCSTIHTFKSGGARELEEASLPLLKGCFHPGKNTLVLENANQPSSGHWVVWDSLSLRDAAGTIIWTLGKNDAPPDYTERAFSEFQQQPPFTTDFDVETMQVKQFPKEVNDGDYPGIAIHFSLTAEQADSDLTLFLDTLYATRQGDQIPGFDMRISVNP